MAGRVREKSFVVEKQHYYSFAPPCLPWQNLAHLFAEAGEDIIFVEAPKTKNQMRKIPKLFNKKPLLINMGPRTPNLPIVASKFLNSLKQGAIYYDNQTPRACKT